MNSRIAIVDLGTNTFHLMIVDIVDGTYEIVFRDRKAVKIGKGGINNNIITDEALIRALQTIKDFEKIIKEKNVNQVYAFGTSAFRNAQNQQEVLNKINQETGLQIKIITGDEEARLIYKGVHSAIKMNSEKALIMDIGGGSVEFIIGNNEKIFWKQSFEIGAQRLVEKYHKHDPILPEEIDKINTHFSEVLKPLLDILEEMRPQFLIGSSGTFDTLSDIYCIREGILKDERDAETPLTFDAFREIYREFRLKNREDRMKIPGMIELRVDMIVVACCLIDFLLNHYSFKKIRVSNYALKEGVLADILEAN